MSKIYLIETFSTFIHGYAVEMDDDMDPKVIAGKIIAETDVDKIKELYQYHVGEKFDQCIPLKEGQVSRVFRAKNDYLKDLSDEEIIEKYTMDYRTNKEEN